MYIYHFINSDGTTVTVPRQILALVPGMGCSYPNIDTWESYNRYTVVEWLNVSGNKVTRAEDCLTVVCKQTGSGHFNAYSNSKK